MKITKMSLGFLLIILFIGIMIYGYGCMVNELAGIVVGLAYLLTVLYFLIVFIIGEKNEKSRS